MASSVPVVAVINSTPDIVDMLRIALEREGFVTVTGLTFEIRDGIIDLENFIRQHEPAVIVYDIAPPYEANWELFKHISSMPVMRDRQFVLTSTNVKQVEKVGQLHQQVYEIVGKPYDLAEVAKAVKEATRVRPSR